MKHVHHVHSYQSNFSVVCGISGCPRTYNKFSSYKKHVYRVHRQDCNLGIGQPITLLPITDATDTEAICDIVQPLEESVDEECGIIDDTTGQPQQQHVTAVSHHAAMMLLQLKQKYKLSQVALDAVTEEFTSLLQYKLSEVEESILKLDHCETREIKLAFQSPTLVDPFYGLHGKYQQEAYFSRVFGLQVQCMVSLHTHTQAHRDTYRQTDTHTQSHTHTHTHTQ